MVSPVETVVSLPVKPLTCDAVFHLTVLPFVAARHSIYLATAVSAAGLLPN